jgi:hypothetical protein
MKNIKKQEEYLRQASAYPYTPKKPKKILCDSPFNGCAEIKPTDFS